MLTILVLFENFLSTQYNAYSQSRGFGYIFTLGRPVDSKIIGNILGSGGSSVVLIQLGITLGTLSLCI
jgi:hypothetical protein